MEKPHENTLETWDIYLFIKRKYVETLIIFTLCSKKIIMKIIDLKFK